MRYVALLRGINVGGKNKIEMSRLRELFNDIGATQVATYINSGNVLFADNRSSDKLAHVIEKRISAVFGYEIPVHVRTADDITSLLQTIPKEWSNDASQRTDVIFLSDAIDGLGFYRNLIYNPAIERVIFSNQALVWNVEREHVRRSNALRAIVASDLYKHMTIRNINTVRKLHQLL